MKRKNGSSGAKKSRGRKQKNAISDDEDTEEDWMNLDPVYSLLIGRDKIAVISCLKLPPTVQHVVFSLTTISIALEPDLHSEIFAP